jgi:hypothetical protein
VPIVEQELLTLPEHLSSPPVFSGVRVLEEFEYTKEVTRIRKSKKVRLNSYMYIYYYIHVMHKSINKIACLFLIRA